MSRTVRDGTRVAAAISRTVVPRMPAAMIRPTVSIPSRRRCRTPSGSAPHVRPHRRQRSRGTRARPRSGPWRTASSGPIRSAGYRTPRSFVLATRPSPPCRRHDAPRDPRVPARRRCRPDAVTNQRGHHQRVHAHTDMPPTAGMRPSDPDLAAQIHAELPAHPPPRSRSVKTRRIAVSTARPMRASSSGSLNTQLRPAEPS